MAHPGGEAYLRSMSDLCGCADSETSSGFVRQEGYKSAASLFSSSLFTSNSQNKPEHNMSFTLRLAPIARRTFTSGMATFAARSGCGCSSCSNCNCGSNCNCSGCH
ncbi:hypothetical protein RTBOTA2_003618 [Rhodotorula toruloides]|nr:hypothetical protein RTBOTA2_003618 [Rhodotorula toruloides]